MTADWLIPGVVFAGLIALLWRQTLTLGKLAGVRTRATDRERHDMHSLVLRLLEKRDTTDGNETARLHKIERLEHARLDAKVEEAADAPTTVIQQASETCSPEDYDN